MSSTANDKPQTRFAPRRLAHANIFVKDLEESLGFYSGLCGLTEVFREPGIKAIFLSNGSSHHDVAIEEVMGVAEAARTGKGGHVQQPSGQGTAPRLNHLGWEMENERALVEAYRRARDRKVDIRRTTNHGMSHSVYLFDPERTFLEFYSDAISDWKAFYAASQGQLISGSWDPLSAPPSTEALYRGEFTPEYVSTAPIKPRRFTRATLIAKDFNQMVAFYKNVAGLSVLHLDETEGVAVLSGTLREPNLAIFAAKDDEAPGLHHLGFELADGAHVGRLYADLQRAKVTPAATTKKGGVVVRSPDGLLLEFYPFSKRGEWAAPTSRSTRDLYLI